jgi:hypothetical protein
LTPRARPETDSPRRAKLLLLALAGTIALPAPTLAQQPLPRRPFRHASHDAIACARCHSSIQQHGRVTIAAPRDCFACHHAPDQRTTCAGCHDTAALRDRAYAIAQSFQVATRPAEQRVLPFTHAEHGTIACATCHTEPLTLAARATDCAACHADHHDASTGCTRCHVPPPAAAHPTTSHVTCTGAGCHSPQPFTEQPRTRTLCLSCHPTYADHKPAGNCVDCHVLPPWHATVRSGRPPRAGGV